MDDMLYDNNFDNPNHLDYKSGMTRGLFRFDPASGEEPFDNLANLYPELENVGVLADEFDRQSTYSEDEGIEDYKKGGYHPVFVGEVLNGRYVIIQKLGWGHFSTVWLSRDTKYNTFVAIKVQKSASHYLEAAFDEVEILQKAATNAKNPEFLKDLKEFYKDEKDEFTTDDCHVVQLLNAFIYQGPYGRHFCMVFEILGVNLLEIIKRYDYKGIPLPICRRMSKQILIGLHYLHKYCGIIHTDLKPENVMVCLNPNELKQIYESGQLHNKQKIESRLRSIRRRIKMLGGGDALSGTDEPDVVSEVYQEGETSVQNTEDTFKRNGHKDSIVVTDFNENEEAISIRPIHTKEDLEQELERLVKERGIESKREEARLRRLLKKKLDNYRKKQKKAAKKPINSLRINLAREEIKRQMKKPISLHPNFYKSGLSDDFKIKIADLGNGCWTHHHFQPEIQTRQYRSPEVILGINYNETADLWSFACMLFEMITGEFLFDPRKEGDISKSQDHLALMMELLNRFPRNYSTIGTNSKKYVNAMGSLRKIHQLNFLSIKDLLIYKYRAKEDEAMLLAEFLMPMLHIYPQQRIGARAALKHTWLSVDSDEIFQGEERLTQQEFPNHTEIGKIDPQFEVIVDEEDFHADHSDASLEDDDEDTPAKNPHDYYEKQCKFHDRSYRNVYVGYADGIDLNALDNTANWQFDRSLH